RLIEDGPDGPHRAAVIEGDGAEEPPGDPVVVDERGVPSRDVEVGDAERDRHGVDGGGEEGPALAHAARETDPSRAEQLRERAAGAEPAGHTVTRLRPPEDPRDRAEVVERSTLLLRAPSRARADVEHRDLRERRRLL